VAIAVLGWATPGDAQAAQRRSRATSARMSPARATATSKGARRLSRTEEAERTPSVKTARPDSAPSVLFVTEKRAYLNRGTLDGLAPRQSIQLLRRGRAMGTCTIENTSDHRATCTGAHARVGDGFRLPASTPAQKRARHSPELPPIVDEQTLRERAEAVGEASYQKVDFNRAHALIAHAHTSISPRFTVWHTGADPRGDYTLEELDAIVQAYDLGGTGLDFTAAFTAMRWGARETTGRFRPTSQSQFYVWEAEVTRRRTDAGTVVAVGRIWPWHTPGLAMLDGLQIGRRNQTETAEGGLYAGYLPLAPSTVPSTESWAAGTYGTLVQTGSNQGTFRLAREEARVGLSGGPGTGLVTDADLLVQSWIGIWNVAAGGRALLAPSVTSGPVLDRATLDLGARPTALFGADVHLRYFGAPLPTAALLTGVVPTARGMLSALANAHWNVSPWLGLAAFASLNQERDTGQSISTGGAEFRLAHIADGLSLGGEIERGWMRGMLAYGQLSARAGERLRLLARVSVSATEFQTPTSAPNVDEAGGYLHVDGALASWLRLRVWSQLRVPFLIEGALPIETSYGLVFGASLTGAM
jgi:hypothetical protein